MTDPRILEAGNIYSNTPLAILTNPTCLAFNRGHLNYWYPITYKHEVYPDVETAYQYAKKLSKWLTIGERETIMVKFMIIKLRTYPFIAQSIHLSGGVKFLKMCRHGYRDDGWEGEGKNSRFIRCLIKAYEEVEDERSISN